MYHYIYNHYLMIKKMTIISFRVIQNILLRNVLSHLYNLQRLVTYTLVRTILPLYNKVQTMCIIILFMFNCLYLFKSLREMSVLI